MHAAKGHETLSASERAEIIEELSHHIEHVMQGAPAISAAVYRDPETEKAVRKECRYVMTLLSRRRRSAAELEARLHERTPADPALVGEVMRRLEDGGLIDDAEFAREWVRQRRELKDLGSAALRRELEAKGIENSFINAALEEGEEDSDKERCWRFVQERLEKELRSLRLSGREPSRRALVRKIGAACGRRGYSTNLTLFVLNRQLDAAGITLY